MNNRIIINADDCGKSAIVNAAIEECIQLGCISSTTVMANMDDLDGAKHLYDKYKNAVSFGAHLDLTEAHPLTTSQILLDYGYFKETDKGIVMCGHEFRHTIFPRGVREAIYKELDAQMAKLLDNGFSISHIDSHRHIHYGFGILPVFVKIAEKYHINKIRRSKTYMKLGVRLLLGKVWETEMKCLDSQIKTTDYFCSFSDFYNKTTNSSMARDNKTFELMVHPGHPKYVDEIQLLKEQFRSVFRDNRLINYMDL